MRKRQWYSFPIAVSVGLLLFATARNGLAQIQEGPYFTADLGLAFVQDMDAVVTDIPVKLRMETGIRLGLGAGYLLYSSSAFDAAVQFETGVIYASADDLTSFDTNLRTDADFYQVPVLGDIIYRFHFGPRLVPYLGIGGGGVYSRLDVKKVDDFVVDYTDSDFSPAVQGMAGLAYKFNERMELGLGYKFLANFTKHVDYVGTHSVSLTYLCRF